MHEGKAHGIGEVGRPHWKVSDEIWERSNSLLLETMKMAAKESIPLQLHVEGESDETYPDPTVMADKAGLDRKKLVRHYAPARVDHSYTLGITPSVLAGSGSMTNSCRHLNNHLMDSCWKQTTWMTLKDLSCFGTKDSTKAY